MTPLISPDLDRYMRDLLPPRPSVVAEMEAEARTRDIPIVGDVRGAGYFHPIADRDRAFGQNDQAANEIAGDVLQSESNAYADRTGKNGERPKMNAGIVQHDENANDQDDVADDLRNSVLQRPIQPAVYQEAVKQK